MAEAKKEAAPRKVPTIGRVVLYHRDGRDVAAMVLRAFPGDQVNLVVFDDQAENRYEMLGETQYEFQVRRADEPVDGTWRWPEVRA